MTRPPDQLGLSLDEPAPKTIPQSSVAMMEVMAQMGMAPTVTAALLSLHDAQFSTEARRFHEGPIIQHDSPWRADTPRWLYAAIRAERLRLICEEQAEGITEGWRVGPAELTAVIYPASMDAPLTHDMSELYLWAAAQANRYNPHSSVTDPWSLIGGQPVSDADVLEPGGRLYPIYRRLCGDIRRKVIKHQTAREREAKRHAITVTPCDKPVPVQLDMF